MNSKILISGRHLSPAALVEINALLENLLRHAHDIIRIRLDLHESGSHDGRLYHTAKAVVEMRGPDLIVSESTEDLFKSIHRVVEKLGRGLAELARRSTEERRHPHVIDLPVALPKISLP
jgi:ribosomal subunit interface protein